MSEREEYLKAFGMHLRKLREDKGLSHREFAFKIEKDKSSFQKVEWGKVNPSLLYLQQIADGLEIPLSELVDFKHTER